MQDWCVVSVECTIRSEIVLAHTMILLGNEAQVEGCLSPFGDNANLGARLVRGLCRMYHQIENHLGHTMWNS
jgi:hypothetical protein